MITSFNPLRHGIEVRSYVFGIKTASAEVKVTWIEVM